jgi:hypothetical protein
MDWIVGLETTVQFLNFVYIAIDYVVAKGTA